MGTITVNVTDKVEDDFRRVVNQAYGKKKGVLGKALSEAMTSWSMKKKYFDVCMKLLEEGIDMGRLKYKNREELHDRD